MPPQEHRRFRVLATHVGVAECRRRSLNFKCGFDAHSSNSRNATGPRRRFRFDTRPALSLNQSCRSVWRGLYRRGNNENMKKLFCFSLVIAAVCLFRFAFAGPEPIAADNSKVVLQTEMDVPP